MDFFPRSQRLTHNVVLRPLRAAIKIILQGRSLSLPIVLRFSRFSKGSPQLEFSIDRSAVSIDRKQIVLSANPRIRVVTALAVFPRDTLLFSQHFGSRVIPRMFLSLPPSLDIFIHLPNSSFF